MLALFTSIVVAQAPQIIDINTSGNPLPGNPSPYGVNQGEPIFDIHFKAAPFATLGGKAIFNAAGADEALPYVTDGTPAGTLALSSIALNPSSFTTLNGITYFGAISILSGGGGDGAVWKTDGTVAGTSVAFDLSPGAPWGQPFYMTVLQNRLLFYSSTSASNHGIWASDGTLAGTTLLTNQLKIDGSMSSIGPTRFYVDATGQKAYFQGQSDTLGSGLWVTDGTPGGTTFVSSVTSSLTGVFNGFHLFGGAGIGSKFVFTGVDPVHGLEPWVTDGTPAGTSILKDMVAGASGVGVDFRHAVLFAGQLYFPAHDSVNGSELWRTDGTTAGTVLVADVTPGAGGSSPYQLTVFGPHLYFTAQDGGLWRIDANGQLEQMTNFGTSGAPVVDAQTAFLATGGRLYFVATTLDSGAELWATDGVTVERVADIAVGAINSEPKYLTPLTGGRVVFSATEPQTLRQLWISDGTAPGTVLLKNFGLLGGSSGSNPLTKRVTWGDRVYFMAHTQETGRELYRWDAVSGVKLAAEMTPGTADTQVDEMVLSRFGGKPTILMSANVAGAGAELWTFDGLTATLLKDIAPNGGSNPADFVSNGKETFFTAQGDAGRELWVTDGTSPGTRMIKDLLPGPATSKPDAGVFHNGELIFSADNGVVGHELWATDGTGLGTRLISDVFPGAQGSFPQEFKVVGDQVVFVAFTAGGGRDLWRTDGTAAGTARISAFSSGLITIESSQLTLHQGQLYFAAQDNAHGTELWKTDLTLAGTQLVADVQPGAQSSFPKELVSTPSGLIFIAAGTPTNREIWVSDGTAAGTQLLADVYPGEQSSLPAELVALGKGVLLAAQHPVAGRELCYVDSQGLQLLADLNVGSDGSAPTRFTVVDGHVLFAADLPAIGNELAVYAPDRALVQDLGLGGNGSSLAATTATLGGTVTVMSQGHTPGLVHALLYSTAVPVPSNFLMDAVSTSWIDLANVQIARVFMTPSLVHMQVLPATPGLIGAEVHAQVWTLPNFSFPATAGNGIALTLGN